MSPITRQRGASSSSSSSSSSPLSVEGEPRLPSAVHTPVDADKYSSLNEVTQALRQAGLDSSNLIVGIDFTRSNLWNGQCSFNGDSLHTIGQTLNPYQHAISIIGATLSEFDGQNLIHGYGFGDASTRDKNVFCFNPNESPCHGYAEVLECYRKLVPLVKLAGPTSFAPLIEMAMTIVERSGGQHHVLLIIADGQEAVRIDTESGQVKIQDPKTINAIASASKFPLSIVLMGVGDGPWDMMKAFDCAIPVRAFNNFQFANYSEIMSRSTAQSWNEAALAYAALSEVPQQFQAAVKLGILGQNIPMSPGRAPLPPPVGTLGASLDRSESFGKTSTDIESSLFTSAPDLKSVVADFTAALTCAYQVCAICYVNPEDMAFGCGHKFCSVCGPTVNCCPICRCEITTTIKLHCQETVQMADPVGSTAAYGAQDVCPVCHDKTKDMAFDCGHLTCCTCGPGLDLCPICDGPITIRIKLF